MSNDNKTLAEVQPGGRVRLGDQAERARFEAFLSRNPLTALCAGTAWEVWQAALSAQPSPPTCKEGLQVHPSPGGQGDAREREGWRKMQKAAASQTRKDGVGACDALYELAVKHGANDAEAAGFAHHVNGSLALLETQTHDGLHREATMEAALAARQPVGDHLAQDRKMVSQPVGEPVAWYYGFSDTGEAGPVTFGGNPGAEAIAWAERHGHTLHYLYAAPPAQAVDLGQIIDQIAQQWDGCSYDAVGETIDIGQAIRAAGKRLIDSQAVGNA